METAYYRILCVLSVVGQVFFMGNSSLMAHPLSDAGLPETDTTLGLNGSLRGTVMLQGRTEGNMATDLKIQLFKPGEIVPVHIEEMYSDDSGEFFIGDITPGDYVLAIKNIHTLQLAAAIRIASGTETVISFRAPLLEGDANNDNQIDEADFTLLSKAFGTFQGGKGYNSVADFNADATISVLDFSLLAENYDTKGYHIHEDSYTELSSMAAADMYLLIVDKVFFRRYYAGKGHSGKSTDTTTAYWQRSCFGNIALCQWHLLPDHTAYRPQQPAGA